MDPVRSKKSEISADLPEASRTSNGMDKEKVLNLAKLARIEMGHEEAESLTTEIGSILNYVSEITSANVSGAEAKAEDFVLKNVFREDAEPHEAGIYRESLLSQAPRRDGDYIQVKKIL